MATHVDDRENLEPGAGISTAPPPLLGEAVPADPYAGYEDYFAFDKREKWFFPDGKQWIEFKRLNEGERARFLKATRPDVTINQKSGDAKIPFDQANDRKELILHSATAWHVVRRSPKTGNWEAIPFTQGSGGTMAQWLNTADPSVVSDLEKAIRKSNPWLLAEMSVEQIDKEIADLEELKRAALEREGRDAAFQETS